MSLDQPSFTLPVQQYQLDNGLRVILQPDPRLPLVATSLWYHVGSKNERPGRTGFAHLFEHMLFQGSQHVGTNDHFQYIQQAGGSANGSTWFDRTNYHQSMPAHQLDIALWLESDRMGYLLPAMTQEKLDTQRSVVINERRQRIDNRPYGRCFERIHERLYPGDHPYHSPVIGYIPDLEAAALEDVSDFFRTFYAPNNAVLTLCGEFEPAAALEAVERYFGELPPAAAPARPCPGQLPALEVHREDLEDDVEVPRVYITFRGAPYGERSWYAAELLTTALAAGKASPLYRDLVHERELAQHASAYVLPFELSGTTIVYATARPGVSADELEAALLEHVERAMAEPPAPEHLERARNRVLTDWFRSVEPIEQRAEILSELATYFGDPERIRRETDVYLDLQPEELSAYAAEFWRPDQRFTLRCIPARQGDGS